MKGIVYFSSDDWESGLKTSQYHIAYGLSMERPLIYINSIGLRAPQANRGDMLKAADKVARFFRGVKSPKPNLHIVTPVLVPYYRKKCLDVINRLVLCTYIKYYISRLLIDRYDILTFLPNVCSVINNLKPDRILYYCADKLTGFEGVDVSEVESMEKQTIALADYTLVTSRMLMEEKKQFKPTYSPHGVDFEHFNSALNGRCQVPQDIRHIKRPILGFFGHISRDWVDFDLIRKICTCTDWSVVLIGKCSHDVPDLSCFENIHMLGVRPYEQLPGYCKAFDIGLIPFNNNALTKYCNPIKVKEYLAAGLPVVSVDIPELDDYAGLIGVAGNHAEFIDLLKSYLKNDTPEERNRRVEFVRSHSWRTVVRRVSDLLQ